jgi:hypothetical protein
VPQPVVQQRVLRQCSTSLASRREKLNQKPMAVLAKGVKLRQAPGRLDRGVETSGTSQRHREPPLYLARYPEQSGPFDGQPLLELLGADVKPGEELTPVKGARALKRRRIGRPS